MKTKIFIPYIVTLLFILFCINTYAQYDSSSEVRHKPARQKEGFDIHRMFTGGDVGLQFGDETMIELYPTLGYKLTDKFAVGMGVTYQYFDYVFSNPYTSQTYSMQTSIYGGNVFARYYAFKRLFIQGEWELLNLETAFFDSGSLYHTGKRYWVGSVFGGIGYRYPIGENSSFNVMLLYNFNDNSYNPYYTSGIPLVYQVGFEIGL